MFVEQAIAVKHLHPLSRGIGGLIGAGLSHPLGRIDACLPTPFPPSLGRHSVSCPGPAGGRIHARCLGVRVFPPARVWRRWAAWSARPGRGSLRSPRRGPSRRRRVRPALRRPAIGLGSPRRAGGGLHSCAGNSSSVRSPWPWPGVRSPSGSRSVTPVPSSRVRRPPRRSTSSNRVTRCGSSPSVSLRRSIPSERCLPSCGPRAGHR